MTSIRKGNGNCARLPNGRQEFPLSLSLDFRSLVDHSIRHLEERTERRKASICCFMALKSPPAASVCTAEKTWRQSSESAVWIQRPSKAIFVCLTWECHHMAVWQSAWRD